MPFRVGASIPLVGYVALELDGDQHTGRATMLLDQLARGPPGRVSVAAALRWHVERRTVLVRHARQPVLIALGQRGRADPPDDTQAELHRPASYRYVSKVNAASCQQLLNLTQAYMDTARFAKLMLCDT